VPDVEATSPGKAIEDVRKTLLIFNVIMLSGAVMAVVVGGLAVINTMVMSVHERTREIGVKKAVGAEDFDILAEYVTEAALIGFVGGLIGLILGWGMANFLNETVAKEIGGEIFTVTPRLAMGALVFSVVLGMVAGLYPAWRAAKLDPVMALRTE
jgi:putative ABC transport system permease protein